MHGINKSRAEKTDSSFAALPIKPGGIFRSDRLSSGNRPA